MIELDTENMDMNQFEQDEEIDSSPPLIIHESGKGFRFATLEEEQAYLESSNTDERDSQFSLDSSVPEDENPFANMIKGAASLSQSLKEKLEMPHEQKADENRSFIEQKREEFEKMYSGQSIPQLKEILEILNVEMRVIKERIQDCIDENKAQEDFKNEKNLPK